MHRKNKYKMNIRVQKCFFFTKKQQKAILKVSVDSLNVTE